MRRPESTPSDGDILANPYLCTRLPGCGATLSASGRLIAARSRTRSFGRSTRCQNPRRSTLVPMPGAFARFDKGVGGCWRRMEARCCRRIKWFSLFATFAQTIVRGGRGPDGMWPRTISTV